MESQEGPGPPGDEKEDQLREMWAKVLHQPINTLETSSNFFLSGGDSLSAIRLVALARENVWDLTLQHVYTHPVLRDMVQVIHPLKKFPLELDPKPQFEVPTLVKSLIAMEVKVDSNKVQSIFPGSAIQEGFIALAATDDDAHIIQYKFIIPPESNLARLKESWRRVVNAHRILRTRFYHSTMGIYQVVLTDDFHWETQERSTALKLEDKIKNEFRHLNGSLSRFYLLTDDDNSHLLVWAVSHALTDHWASSQIFAEVHAAYLDDSEIPRERPYNEFTQAEDTITPKNISYFWNKQLNHGKVVEYPVLPYSQFRPITSSQHMSQFFVSYPPAPSKYTFALRVRAAWAITVSEVTQYCHVLFGLSLTGRNRFLNVAVWPYALVIQVRAEVAMVEISMEYDDRVFNEEEIQDLMGLFSLVLLRLLGYTESQTVNEILTGLSTPPNPTELCQNGRIVEYFGRLLDVTKIEKQIADIIGIDQSLCYVKPLQLGEKTNDVVLSGFINTDNADAFTQYVTTLETELGKYLPTHMTPDLYLPFPIVEVLSPFQREVIKSKYSQKTSFKSSSAMSPIGCLTLAEDILMDCWEQVLGIKTVSLDANFLSLGGDSIKAVRLTHAARVANLQLSVDNVLSKPVLRHMAAAASIIEYSPNRSNFPSAVCGLDEVKESEPFPLDRGLCDPKAIFPVSPYQHSTFSDSLRNPGSYVLQTLYKLHSEFDGNRFESAWNRVCVEFPNLRTSFRAKSGTLFQVIACELTKPEQLQFANLNELKKHMKHILSTVTQVGVCLSQIILAEVGPQKEPERYMVFSIHQAIFDTHTLLRIHKALIQAYHDESGLPPPVALGEYITFLDSQKTAIASRYWRQYLRGADPTIFPPYPSGDYITHPDQEHRVTLQLRESPIQTIKIPTVIRAAWGILLTTFTRTRDATYCELDIGRTAKTDDIENYAGPTSNLIPIRIKVEDNLDLTIRNFLGEIQIQTSRMRPYTGLGLETIASLLPENFKLFDFHSLLVIHQETGREEKAPEKDIPMRAMSSSMKLDGCLGLMLQCVTTTGGLCMNVRWDETLISNNLIEILCLRMEYLLRAMIEGNPLLTVQELRKRCCYF
ncbi:acetyl-CoA synthetase-like protein [Penicillium herquei]|nr:acetyl-CoA synthetase-like protein [Penicillium herquei]